MRFYLKLKNLHNPIQSIYSKTMKNTTKPDETAIAGSDMLTPVIEMYPELPAIADGNYWIVEAIRHHFWTFIVYSKDDITNKKNKGDENCPYDWKNALRVPLGKKLIIRESYSIMGNPFSFLGALRYLPRHL